MSTPTSWCLEVTTSLLHGAFITSVGLLVFAIQELTLQFEFHVFGIFRTDTQQLLVRAIFVLIWCNLPETL